MPSASVQAAWTRQLTWLGLGLRAFLVVTRLSVRFLEWAALPGYLLAIGLLVVTLLFGSGGGTAKSMSGWLTIGGVRLGQPSELAKIAVAVMLARVLASYRVAPRSLVGPDQARDRRADPVVTRYAAAGPRHWPGLHRDVLRDVVLDGRVGHAAAARRQPGHQPAAGGQHRRLGLPGSSSCCVIVWNYKPYVVEGVVLVVANVMMGVAAPIVWNQVLKVHQRERLLVFLDPSLDPKDAGYQMAQSRIAIGSGGWTGKGFTQGSQKRLAFLPEQHTDFIFAVVGEELGFLGVAAALTLFLFLFLRVIRVATRASDSFSSLVAFGLAGKLVRARDHQRGHDDQPDADHRHSVAVLLLRWLVPPGVLDRRWNAGEDLGEGRGRAWGDLGLA